jgi:fermentation-respiration switch protein FrsA (DUF1100 family)
MINKILIIIGLTIIAFILFYFAFSFFVASQTVASNHGPFEIPASTISNSYENFTIPTQNSKLNGWLFHGPTDKLIIMVAGDKQNRVNNEYYGSLITKELIGLGYSVLLYDNQATGESLGTNVTFGVKESKDLISIVEFAKSKGFKAKNIGIIADSTGATSLLLACDKLKDIGAMVVDSPAKNIQKNIENILRNENSVPILFNPGIFFVLKYYYHIDVDAVKPASHVAAVPERIFLYLHGGLDDLIYPSESKELLAISNPKSKLVIFPNGKHIETYKSNPVLYRLSVFTFLKLNLSQ